MTTDELYTVKRAVAAVLTGNPLVVSDILDNLYVVASKIGKVNRSNLNTSNEISFTFSFEGEADTSELYNTLCRMITNALVTPVNFYLLDHVQAKDVILKYNVETLYTIVLSSMSVIDLSADGNTAVKYVIC